MRLKKRFLAAAAAGTVVLSTVVASPALAAPGDPVAFPDAAFKACVNSALQQPATATITEAQAASISYLNCNVSAVADLTGAQSLTGLKDFEAVLASITDLGPLSGLTSLQSLELWANEITSVSPLAGLVNLTRLGVTSNKVTDLSPLGGLTNLTDLSASGQSASVSVPCAAPYTNPVKNRDGSAVPLTGQGYNSATNTIDTSVAGTFSFAWNTPTPGGGAFEGTLAVTVRPCPAAPAITSGAPTTPATVGTAYSFRVTATGVPAPTFSITAGALPAGLTLNPATGVISGTPTASGSYSFTVTATNPTGTDAQPYSIVVDAKPAITSDAPTAGVTGSAYSFTVTASGSPAPTFSVTSGSLPAGLTLDPTTGVISGTPTATGSFTFTITATNSAGTDAQRYTVAVDEVPAITSAAPTASGVVGTPYSFTVTASGVPAPTFSITAGALPAGLSLDATTGAISGTPTAPGPAGFTVTATNSVGSDSADYVIAIDAAPAITSGAPTGVAAVGKPYAFTVTATGAPAPTFAVSAGALPDGLTLDAATGEITGTPTQEGDYALSISATNRVGSVTADYSITVEASAPPVITSGNPHHTTVGSVYDFTVTASGAPAPTFAVTAGALPDGLALDAATGKITGTATTAGTFTFTVAASNSEGTDTAEYTIQVEPADGGDDGGDGDGDGGGNGGNGGGGGGGGGGGDGNGGTGGNGNGGGGTGGTGKTGSGSGTGTTGTTTTGDYTLASTGADILPYGIGGLVILLAGAALLLVRRRTNAEDKA